MKRLRKILIIISLSLFLTSTLTPKHEKKADAFVLTSAMVFGTLAVLGAGGIVAYQNREAIKDLGDNVVSRLNTDGISVSDMMSTNEIGLNHQVTQRIAESIQEKNSINYAGDLISFETITLAPGSMKTIEFNDGFYSKSIDSWENIVIRNHFKFTGMTPFDHNEFTVRIIGRHWLNLSNQSVDEFNIIWDNDHNAFSQVSRGEITFNNSTNQTMNVEGTMKMFNSSYAEGSEQLYNSIPQHDNIEDYMNQINSVYADQTVSIDYERLEDIFTNADSEPIALNNIQSLVHGLADNIEGGFDDTVGVLSQIWNGIKDIPSIMATNATAVLGGISSLGDTLLDGLSTGLDNLSKANEQLWQDAGVVWSGISDNINALGQTLSDVLTPPLTAMNDRLYDFTGVMADIPNTIRTGITDGMANIGEKLNDLSSSVKEIPGTITTSVTDTWSSAFAVPDNYFIDRTSSIMEIINPKLPQFPSKEALFPSDFDEKGDWAGITADFSHYGIGEQMVIDNEAPNYYRRQIKLWISAILYFFTALFVIKKTAGVIRS